MLDFRIACTCTMIIFKPEKDFGLSEKCQDTFCIKNKTKAATRFSAFQRQNSVPKAGKEAFPLAKSKAALQNLRSPHRINFNTINYEEPITGNKLNPR